MPVDTQTFVMTFHDAFRHMVDSGVTYAKIMFAPEINELVRQRGHLFLCQSGALPNQAKE